MEIGWEKLRYVSGIAVAVNWKGEQKSLNLSDIHTEAETLGPQVTPCEY